MSLSPCHDDASVAPPFYRLASVCPSLILPSHMSVPIQLQARTSTSNPQPGPTSGSVNAFQASTTGPPPRADNTATVGPDDTFGITYRPIRVGQPQSQAGATLPSGPAFEDEAEFEEDLLGSDLFANKRAKEEEEEEDDFGGDFAPVVQVTEVLRQAREQYSTSTTEVATTVGVSPLPPLPPPPPLEFLAPFGEGEGEGEVVGPSEGPPTSLDLRAAAAQALNELADIYGQGFGDQEVRGSMG